MSKKNRPKVMTSHSKLRGESRVVEWREYLVTAVTFLRHAGFRIQFACCGRGRLTCLGRRRSVFRVSRGHKHAHLQVYSQMRKITAGTRQAVIHQPVDIRRRRAGGER